MINKVLLEKYNKKQYSQAGEDLFLKDIFATLNKEITWVCEFGAWDGIHLSNTFYFVLHNDANAIYIEGDKNKFQNLLNTCKEFSKITPINKFIDYQHDSNNSLNKILQNTDIPKEFDILSIDIDSVDLEVWEKLSDYNPICVVIEINNLIPPGIFQRHKDMSEQQIKNKGKTWLNSFSSTVEVGLKKNYTPIKHIGWNLIFIKNEYLQNLNNYIIDDVNDLFNFRWILREKRKDNKKIKRQRKLMKREVI